MSHPARSTACSISVEAVANGEQQSRRAGGSLSLLLELLICLWGNLEGEKAPAVLGVTKVIPGTQSRCQMSHGS